MSLIGDSFPPEKRGLPVGIYSTALALGAGIASLIGATVLGMSEGSVDVVVPLSGAVRPWQFALIVVGLPGLVLAPLFLHLVNDLPGSLVRMRRALRPDGLMLAAIPGAGTLAELND
eukprot:gene51004-69386_t